MASTKQTFTASDGTVFEDRAGYRRYEFELLYSFRKRSNATLMKGPGSLKAQPFDISDCDGCEILLLDHTDQVQIDNCNKSRVLISASSESVFVRDCNDCTFTVACKQLRTRDCHNCTFYLYSKTEPIIELSDAIIFAPFNVAYPQHAEHLRLANLDPQVNFWNKVFDFNDEQRTGAHWRLWNDELDGQLDVWRPLEDTCEMAIPITNSNVAGALRLPPVSQKGCDEMTTFGLEAMQADAQRLSSNAVAANATSDTEKWRKKKSAIGWDPQRSEAKADPLPPAQADLALPCTTTRRKSAIGWNPDRLMGEEESASATERAKKGGKKSAIGWGAQRSEADSLPLPQGDPLPSSTTRTEAAIGWNPDRVMGKGESKAIEPVIIPKKTSLIGWNPSPLLRESSSQAQAAPLSSDHQVGQSSPLIAGDVIMPKRRTSSIGWDPSRLAESSQETQATLPDVPSSPDHQSSMSADAVDSGVVAYGDVSLTRTPAAVPKKKHQIGWSEERLSGGEDEEAEQQVPSASALQLDKQQEIVLPELAPSSLQAPIGPVSIFQQEEGPAKKELNLEAAEEGAAKNEISLEAAEKGAAKKEVSLELQALLFYAMERGVKLDKWFSDDDGHLILHRSDFVKRLEGLAFGLCAGSKNKEVQEEVSKALAPSSIQTAVEVAASKGKEEIDILLLLTILGEPPVVGEGKADGRNNQPSTSAQQSKGRFSSTTKDSIPKPRLTTPPAFAVEREPEVKARIQKALETPQSFHALKVRLGTLPNPLLVADLITGFTSVGLALDRSEAQVLMWSIRSLTEKKALTGIPLRLSRAEVMTYVSTSRGEKALKYGDWAQKHQNERAQRQRKIDREFQKALEGCSHRVEAAELGACLRNATQADIIPKAMLQVEIEGRAHDTAHSNDGNYVQAKVQEEKDRLWEVETSSKGVSYSLLSRYIKECSLKHYQDTVPLQSWLEKRMATWNARHDAFREWLQAKITQKMLEREQKASRAAALVHVQGINTIKQGREIIETFADLAVPSAKEGQKASIKKKSLDKGRIAGLAVEHCFDHVLQTLCKSPSRPLINKKDVVKANNMDLVESAKFVLACASEAVTERAGLAENDFKAWKIKKALEKRRRKKQEKVEQEQKEKEKADRVKAAKASFHRWLRLDKRHKYWSKQSRKTKPRPPQAPTSKKTDLQPEEAQN